ncbi:hypothetical protein KC19_3G127700 [Ceratodon purpureus]|uniref:Uncharacterized protein n=1 Tax=Ceratodon purpureus TaxID=3225 RepID=A0A8T0IK47_CERPU|nr:hypothetical protein KC19_3G127700 [Ceratodon purpureus]
MLIMSRIISRTPASSQEMGEDQISPSDTLAAGTNQTKPSLPRTSRLSHTQQRIYPSRASRQHLKWQLYQHLAHGNARVPDSSVADLLCLKRRKNRQDCPQVVRLALTTRNSLLDMPSSMTSPRHSRILCPLQQPLRY